MLTNTLKAESRAGAVCSSGVSCFVAGTLVHTADGLKPIETFVGGELVLSRSDETGTFAYQPVLATKATPLQEIYEVKVQNATGEIEAYTTTEEHPFWVVDQGWRKAALLEAGIPLVDSKDKLLHVVSLTKQTDLDTVYNIQVHEFETYHVGTFGTWVHNNDCCQIAKEFEAKLYNLPVGERVALVKTEASAAADTLGMTKDSRLTRMNGREVYKDSDGNLYSLDTQHGRWESINPKTGAHQGEK